MAMISNKVINYIRFQKTKTNEQIYLKGYLRQQMIKALNFAFLLLNISKTV